MCPGKVGIIFIRFYKLGIHGALRSFPSNNFKFLNFLRNCKTYNFENFSDEIVPFEK